MMGRYTQAESLFLEENSIEEKYFGKEHYRYAQSLNDLANLYMDMKKYPEAEELYLTSIAIKEKTLGKEHPSYAISLNNLAGFYEDMKNYSQAEALYLESKAIRAKVFGQEHLTYAVSLNNLADLYSSMGNYARSEMLHLETKNIKEKILGKEHPDCALALNNLATLYYDMNRLDSAFAFCLAGIAANSEQIDSSFSLDNLKQLDRFDYYSLSHINTSMKTLMDILQAQYKKTEDKTKLEQRYQVVQAILRFIERTRNDFNNEGDKLRVLQSNASYVQNAISMALLLDKEVHLQEAFSFAELNKSVLLADAVKGNRARSLGGLPDTLVEKEIALSTALADLKKEQYEAKTATEKELIHRSLNDLTLEIDAFLKSLKEKYPKYHALKYENITAKVADIQSLLDDETLLIEYFQAKKILYLFVISKNKVELFPLNLSKEDLEEKIKVLRQALSNYTMVLKKEDEAYRQYTQNAHWFYKEILEIGLKGKKAKNLIIVADGELGHLPFEVFLVQAAPQKETYQNLHYLVKDYNISYNYSATLLKENANTPTQSNNGKILACAANYAPVEPSLATLRLPYFYTLRTHLQPLPAAQTEIAELAKYFQGDFLWNDSTNERFFKENAQNYGIIHLAMHGILDAKQPMLSSLAFTENMDTLEDNFLQAFEISRLNLNADLVVLSACETGYGKFTQGEGVVSIARSFMYAGVPSLVVSLWQVNDHSTALIMKSFYANLADGMTKDAALRQAKLDYIQQAHGVMAHPAFWSPFIQLGNRNAIYLKKKGAYWSWVLGGGLLVLGAGFIAFRRRKMAA